jgi:DNA polymerase III subunit chi
VAATRVDFYLLGASDPRARLATACRIAEKACDQGLKVAVRTAGPAETAELDELLWTFSDRSFVPHAVWPAEPAVAAQTPVLVASGAPPDSHRDVLINLGTEPPPDPHAYARICEIVGADDAAKRQARVRFRTYRDAGIVPETHQLGSTNTP